MATIKLKRGTSTPTTSDIVNGEVALDLSAKKLYVNDSGTIKEIGADSALTASQLNDINVVAGQVAHGTDLGSIADSLSSASGATNITTVADDITNVNTVAGSITNVNTVAGSIANVNTVAGNNSNVTAVAGNATNINAVANNATNINAVNANKTNIDAVAGNNSNITAVKNNATNINSVASNSSNINSAVSNASNINSAVSNATNINTVAGSIADVNRYANEYKIASSAPSSPSSGDLWYSSAANVLNYYTGSSWVGITGSGLASLAADSSPELSATLDCNNNNLTEVATVSGNNLQIDFGTL